MHSTMAGIMSFEYCVTPKLWSPARHTTFGKKSRDYEMVLPTAIVGYNHFGKIQWPTLSAIPKHVRELWIHGYMQYW